MKDELLFLFQLELQMLLACDNDDDCQDLRWMFWLYVKENLPEDLRGIAAHLIYQHLWMVKGNEGYLIVKCLPLAKIHEPENDSALHSFCEVAKAVAGYRQMLVTGPRYHINLSWSEERQKWVRQIKEVSQS